MIMPAAFSSACARPAVTNVRMQSRPATMAVARKAVRRALGQLSEEHRQVLLLRYMQELDYAEIAAALEISEGTVKSRISRAKMRLRELLDGSGNLFDGGAVLQTEISERREQP